MSMVRTKAVNVPEVRPPVRKTRTVSFRVTDDVYEVLEVAAKGKNINFSTLLSFMIRDYLEIQAVIHKKALYVNSLSEEERANLLRQEESLPPDFRHFTVSSRLYPAEARTGENE